MGVWRDEFSKALLFSGTQPRLWQIPIKNSSKTKAKYWTHHLEPVIISPLLVLYICLPFNWTPHPFQSVENICGDIPDWTRGQPVPLPGSSQMNIEFNQLSSKASSKWRWSFQERHHLITHMVLFLTAFMMCVNCSEHILFRAIPPKVWSVYPGTLDFGGVVLKWNRSHLPHCSSNKTNQQHLCDRDIQAH